MGKIVKMRIIIILSLFLTLSFNTAWAGGNLTNISETTTIISLDSLSSSPISKKERERKEALLKKIEEIQKQFEEAEKLSQMGMSKDEIERMYQQAMEVLNGAAVVCSSEIIN